eukprot:UN32340
MQCDNFDYNVVGSGKKDQESLPSDREVEPYKFKYFPKINIPNQNADRESLPSDR